jgi:glutamate-1-semialdehyde 2,1-aminomutase
MNSRDKSTQLFARSQQVTPGGVHSPVRAFSSVGGQPVFIDSAQGAWLTDVDGNRYLDFCMSWGPLIFGHTDQDIAAAAKAAIDKGSSFGAAEATSLELAELICGSSSWLEKIRFVSSGTEAVMSAIRVARAATGRDKILKFDGCYHGHADSMLVRAGSGLADLATPDSAGVPTAVAAQTLVAPLDNLPAIEALFAAHGDDIAAVIVEPVPANFGLLLQAPDYLQAIARITRQHGALLIFDEVITGFRLAFGGAAELFNIQPDLVTYGKIIGGGFPVGAFGGRAELMDQLAPAGSVYQAGTLSANPVAMAAGLATLQKLQHIKPYQKLTQLGDRLASAVDKLNAQIGQPLSCRHIGSLFWLEAGSSADHTTRSPAQIAPAHAEQFASMFNNLLEHNIYLAPSPFEIGFLSTAHTDEHIDLLIAGLQAALTKTS